MMRRLQWTSLISLILLFPVAAAFFLLGKEDSVLFICWFFALSLPGLAVWPLVLRLAPEGETGYLLSKGLGLLIPAFLVWTLSWLHILPFQAWAIRLSLFSVGVFAWTWKQGYKRVADVIKNPKLTGRLVGSECFFLLTLLLGTYARGLKPDLDSLEKFMDIGFMNTLWRTNFLPAPDMWFSGGNINYYYFGQYAYTYLGKLTGIRPEIAYNLSMATTFSLTLILAYSAGRYLLSLYQQNTQTHKTGWRTAGGMLSALLVGVAGNGHAFFYLGKEPGHSIIRWAQSRGLISGSIDSPYWFADATRFIGYNPDTADKTIHEFPFYSFLVADLHAHLINLAFVLILITLFVALIRRKPLVEAAAASQLISLRSAKSDDRSWYREEYSGLRLRFKRTITDSLLFLIGILLAVFMMGNYWDFAIYTGALMIVLFWMNRQGHNARLRAASFFVFAVQGVLLLIPYVWIPRPLIAWIGFALVLLFNHYLTLLQGDALTLTGAQISWLLFLSHTFALPFNQAFEPIAKTIARTTASTPLWQLLVLWGAHLLAGIILLVVVIVLNRKKRARRFPPPDESISAEGSSGRFLKTVNIADILVLSLFFWAVFLIILPECVYVVDIYSGDFKRANTMFKFTYQAFVLLSLVWAYALARIMAASVSVSGRLRRLILKIASVLLVLLLIIPFSYPFSAAKQWYGSFSRTYYQGLCGLDAFAKKDSSLIPGQSSYELTPDVEAIRWLNQNVTDHPVVLEASGKSYTDCCRISAFTGLPTVIGWETHEWLWRTSKENPNAYGTWVLPRQQDVEAIYTTSDDEQRRQLINQYNIDYIVVGAIERARFRTDENDENSASLVKEDAIKSLGAIVFSHDDLFIVALSEEP